LEIRDSQTLSSTTKKCIYLLSNKRYIKISTLIFLIILTGVIPSVNSLLLQNITDSIDKYSNQDLKCLSLSSLLLKWIVIYGAWLEATNILWRIYDYAYMKIIPTIKARVVDYFYDHIQYHEHRFFQSNLAGDISNRITEASRSLEMIFAYAAEKILRKLAILVFALFTLYTVHTVIALIFCIWLISFISISLYFSRHINEYSTIYGRDKALVSGKIVDAISNITAIRIFDSYKYEGKYLGTYLDKSVRSDQNMQWFMFKLRYVLGMSCTLMICAMMYYVIDLRSNLTISIGQCILIITLCIAVIDDIWDLTQSFGDLFEQMGSFNQSTTLLTKHKITDKSNAYKLIVEKPLIEFKNVTFCYQHNDNKFDNQSVAIKPFEKVGLVGFSGSGKTTFANLISRLYDIEDGQILIDGQNISEVSIASLHENISVIPQEPILFHRSVKDNIRYGNPNATDEEIYEAAKFTHIHEFILGLRGKYETICGERGNNFSGGQRQRIIIARAFLKKSPILILDEATSSLDMRTEKLVQESLHNLMRNKTVLVVAHRFSTLLSMDRILVFDKGHIVEDGSHDELRKKGNIYKMLCDTY